MALTNAYTDLPTVKARLNIPLTAPGEDATLVQHISAASRWIDQHCGRRFYAMDDTRYYTPSNSCLLVVDDLLSVTTLKADEDGDRTYETTWSATLDYYLNPPNAVADGLPYDRIEADLVNGRYRFPRRPRAVQLVGSFGYCTLAAVPPAVVEATLLLVTRLYKRTDAPLGVTGTLETGILRLTADRDILDLLWPYRLIKGIA